MSSQCPADVNGSQFQMLAAAGCQSSTALGAGVGQV